MYFHLRLLEWEHLKIIVGVSTETFEEIFPLQLMIKKIAKRLMEYQQEISPSRVVSVKFVVKKM